MNEANQLYQDMDVIAAYDQMELVPWQIVSCIQQFDQQVTNEKARHTQAINAVEQRHQHKMQEMETARRSACEEAAKRKNEYYTRLDSLGRSYEESMEKYNAALHELPHSGEKLAIGQVLNAAVDRIRKRLEKEDQEFGDEMTALRQQVEALANDQIKAADATYQEQFETQKRERAAVIEKEDNEHQKNMQRLYDEAIESVNALHPDEVRTKYEFLETIAPADANYEPTKEIPDAVQIGNIVVDLHTMESLLPNAAEVIQYIRESFSFALKDTEDGNASLQFAVGRSFSDTRMNQAIIFDSSNREKALEYMRALEMRYFMSIPCGSFRVTMIDPIGLGENFNAFSCLGDDDERIISTKIWSQADRIEQQLTLLINQIEHVHQDCLRDEFKDIVSYNAHVGKNAEPMQMLFVADFPRNLTKNSISLLEKIISSGPKCGVYTILSVARGDFTEDLPLGFREMWQLNVSGHSMNYNYKTGMHIFSPVAYPSPDNAEAIMTALRTGIKNSGHVEIGYDEISDDLTQHPERWFSFKCDDGIEIPIGLEGARRTVSIHLGGENSIEHHALISGTTGSGKSTLLHTIITSLLLRYSPEDVQIYLLDFKHGVESKIYADWKLPNFRVISVDTEPEFGYSVLQSLVNKVIASRSNLFKSQNDRPEASIEQYNREADKDTTGKMHRIPRIVFIADEFQEMFRDEESDNTKKCKQLIKNIAQQGRSFGVHLILASQVLPDVLSDVYGLMYDRIALRSTPESATYILNANNPGVETLENVSPGKGIFNNSGGSRDANHAFRVAIVNTSDHDTLLQRIAERQKEVLFWKPTFKPRLLLSTIQDDRDNPLNRFTNTGLLPASRAIGCPLYLGEEIAMVDRFHITLRAKRMQNLLIMGADSKQASTLYGFAAMSILFNSYLKDRGAQLHSHPIISFFDFKNLYEDDSFDGAYEDVMNTLCARFPNAIRIFGSESLIDGIDTLTEELENNTQGTEHYVIFAGINRARRLQNTNGYDVSPKAKLEKLIREGPAKGCNFIVWANEPAAFLSLYGDLLQEFDYRLVYGLNEDQYIQTIQSAAMSTTTDTTVISYNPDDDIRKIRIYSQPLPTWMNQFMDRLDSADLAEASDAEDDISEAGEYDEFGEFGEFSDNL